LLPLETDLGVARMHPILLSPLLALAALVAPTPLQEGVPVLPPDGAPPVTTPTGLTYSVLAEGNGAKPEPGNWVRVNYAGWFTDGQLFDASRNRGGTFGFTLGNKEVITGWDEGVALMKKGSRYKFTLPPALAYGADGSRGRIPPNSTLVFEIELLDFVKLPEFRKANPAEEKRLDSGIVYEVLAAGEGDAPGPGKVCEVEFALFNTGGKLLDCSAKQARNVKEICGEAQLSFMNEILPLMKPGARWRVAVPPALAFGPRQMGPDLPGQSETVWEIHLARVVDPLPMPEFRSPDPERAVKTPSGLVYEVIKPGTGKQAQRGDSVVVHYAGWLEDGKVFDATYRRAEPSTIRLGAVIEGWNEGLPLMQEGAIYLFRIPSNLGYGVAGRPPMIPPGAVLTFYLELLRVEG
jgi:FKBP-type peptidyl-prolyl cis-trans isomerase